MYILFLIVHVIVCLFLIVVVLLQSGKAADLAGAFGGMGSQTAFGPRGSATLLSKATTISAVLFMITSLGLSILATRNAGLGATVLEEPATKSAPAPAKSVPLPIPGQPAQAPGGQAPSTTFQIPVPPPNQNQAPAPANQPPAAPKK
jgi:preprotein translocase subunit SecG